MKLPSEGVKRLNYSTPLNQTLLADIKDMLENVDHNHVILIMGLKQVIVNSIKICKLSKIVYNINYYFLIIPRTRTACGRDIVVIVLAS